MNQAHSNLCASAMPQPLEDPVWLPTRANTLIEVLEWRAALHPQRPALTFLERGEQPQAALTYGELLTAVRRAADGLAAETEPRDRVLIALPNSLDFVLGFLGCMHSGRVAVPVAVPNRKRAGVALNAIAKNAEARMLLARPSDLSVFPARLRPATLGALMEAASPSGARHDPTVLDTAFLQYTSGSTAAPRGAIITNAGLLDNLRGVQLTMQTGGRSVFVSWLPLFHDMGLILNLLHGLYVGGHVIMMSPPVFAQKPLRWLMALSRFRGTIAMAPNFAYDLCVERITAAERDALDLGTWQVAVNAAEPVSSETLEKFSTFFAPCGFRAKNFLPAYGLAEATVFASGIAPREAPLVVGLDAEALQRKIVRRARDPSQELRLVGCGRPYGDEELAIVSPKTRRRCQPDRIGEIWLRGRNVAAGYHGRSRDTKRTFQAEIEDDPDGLWLRTGDLGFLRDGQVFIAGRLKDILIIDGRNYFPQDLERTVRAELTELGRGAIVVAAAPDNGHESVVVFVELRSGRSGKASLGVAGQSISDRVRAAVSDNHDVAVDKVVILPIRGVPRTTSGKLKRAACVQLYRQGRLEPLYEHSEW